MHPRVSLCVMSAMWMQWDIFFREDLFVLCCTVCLCRFLIHSSVRRRAFNWDDEMAAYLWLWSTSLFVWMWCDMWFFFFFESRIKSFQTCDNKPGKNQSINDIIIMKQLKTTQNNNKNCAACCMLYENAVWEFICVKIAPVNIVLLILRGKRTATLLLMLGVWYITGCGTSI